LGVTFSGYAGDTLDFFANEKGKVRRCWRRGFFEKIQIFCAPDEERSLLVLRHASALLENIAATCVCDFFVFCRSPAVYDSEGEEPLRATGEEVDTLRAEVRSLEKIMRQIENAIGDVLEQGSRPAPGMLQMYNHTASLLELKKEELQLLVPKRQSIRSTFSWDDNSFDWQQMFRFNRLQIRQIAECLLPNPVVCSDGCKLDSCRALSVFLGRCALAGTLFQLQLLFGGDICVISLHHSNSC
jgi:hypothetical protein